MREEESKEVKAKERGRQEETEGARQLRKREQKQQRKNRKDVRRRQTGVIVEDKQNG